MVRNLLGHIALIDDQDYKTVMGLGIVILEKKWCYCAMCPSQSSWLARVWKSSPSTHYRRQIIHIIDDLDASMILMSTALTLVDKER